MSLDHAILRSKTFADIRACTRCELAERCRGPVPFSGKTPNRLMILGEAPGPVEDKYNKLPIGPAYKEMGQLFKDAGLKVDDYFIANSVCCYPHEAPGASHVKACSVNLRAQIELCDPEWVLCLGSVALSTIGVKGKLQDIHGRPFLMPYGPFIGRNIMPTYHLAAGFRDLSKHTLILDDLVTMRKLLTTVGHYATVRVNVGRGGKVG